MSQFTLKSGHLTLKDIRHLYQNHQMIQMDKNYDKTIQSAVNCIQHVIDRDQVAYGINTGFGLLAQTRIANRDLESLQRSLVLSHSAGLGQALPDDLVRLIMILKINGLARGYSGVRDEVIQALLKLINHEIYPYIPEKGSVGASGDLAPLAHMAAVLLGEGKARHKGQWLPATEALKIAGLTPLVLAPKEGLALLNGTQVSTAYALKGLFETEHLFQAALVTGCLSVEAIMGSRVPFDARIHQVRGQKGQIDVAQAYRQLLDHNSEISLAHKNCDKVQDPYSFRCQPQVMGACLQQIRFAAEILEVEANAVSDNPIIFHEQDEILSGGNFHAEPVAMAADNLALALAEIGSITERRIAVLMDTHMSKLPAFLVENGGVNSGFMIAQVTAAALASENKALAHPHSVDSIPTSANQEDHVSMAPAAGKRLWQMAENTRGIIAIEWLASCQGLDFHKGLKTSVPLEKARQLLRQQVKYYDKDRFFAKDIDQTINLLSQCYFDHELPRYLLPSY